MKLSKIKYSYVAKKVNQKEPCEPRLTPRLKNIIERVYFYVHYIQACIKDLREEQRWLVELFKGVCFKFIERDKNGNIPNKYFPLDIIRAFDNKFTKENYREKDNIEEFILELYKRLHYV